MDAVFILLAVSAIVGSILGFYFSWMTNQVSGAVLAVVSAMVLQHEDFGFLAGIAIFVVCLSLNQIAYLIGETLVYRGWLARDRGGADSLRGDGRAQIDKGRTSSGP